MSTHCYRLFGVGLSSDFPFATRLLPGTGPADLTFRVSPEPAPHNIGELSPAIYRSRYQTTLHRLPGCELLRFPATGDFYLAQDSIAFHSGVAPEVRPALVEISLLGPVLAYWLERRGILALHASVVGIDGRAVAFLAEHGGGKSGLAAALMRSAGALLLADDVAAIEENGPVFQVRPAYPQMRMWPDQAEHFLGRAEHLPRVHPDLDKRRVPVEPGGLGEFQPEPLPLAAVYVARRREEHGVEIHPLSPMESMIELIRHSFAPELMEAAGLQPGRLDVLARLVRRVPVRRLIYAAGFERLAEAAEAVVRDQRRSSET